MKAPHTVKKPAKLPAPKGTPGRGGQHRTPAGGGTHHKGVVHHQKAAKPRKPPVPGKVRAKKVRKWSPGSDVACCSAEALGTLLALSGRPWSYEDTLALYWRTAADPDSGASILATLEASIHIQAFGLNLEFGPAEFKVPSILGLALPEPHAVAVTPDGIWWSWGEPFDPADWPELVIEEAWAVTL